MAYVRSEAVVSRVIAAETLIVPVRGKVGDLASIYSLNETATVLWEALATPKSVEELRAVILKQYETEPENAAADVDAFLDELHTAGLLTTTSPAGATTE